MAARVPGLLDVQDGEVEDTRHLFLDCPAYAGERAEMGQRVAHVAGWQRMPEMSADDRLLVLLGRRLGSVKVEAAVDLVVKMFLGKVWAKRSGVRVTLNSILHRNDS